jgi:hypothetical protein
VCEHVEACKSLRNGVASHVLKGHGQQKKRTEQMPQPAFEAKVHRGPSCLGHCIDARHDEAGGQNRLVLRNNVCHGYTRVGASQQRRDGEDGCGIEVGGREPLFP